MTRSESHTRSLYETALTLRVDSITAEVVTEMRIHGVRPLLLKGPSISSWLYRDGTPRPYGDSDLLVSPASYRKAGAVLRELGFRPLPDYWDRDSQTWSRDPGSTCVDLHRSLIGVRGPPETLWREFASNTVTLRVGNIDAEVLGPTARAVHIALHAAQHGVDAERPLQDLARALLVVDHSVWGAAAELAHRIDALPAFAAGLRLDPEGVRIGERLGLPGVTLLTEPRVPVSIALEELVNEGSWSTAFRRLFRACFPPAPYMRKWSATHMRAGPAALVNGTRGQWLAYLWRAIWILTRLPPAIRAIHRASLRKSAASLHRREDSPSLSSKLAAGKPSADARNVLSGSNTDSNRDASVR